MSATTEPIADLADGKTKTKIKDLSPELDAALHRWNDQVNTVLRLLRAPAFLLREVNESVGWTDDHRLDAALATTDHCIAMLVRIEDDLCSAAQGKVLIVEKPDTRSA